MASTETLKKADKFFELNELPNTKAMLMKAATTSGKKPDTTTQAARLGGRVKEVRFDRDWVRAYNAVCGFKDADISLTAPQVVSTSLMMYLLSRKEHPFPMLGMVHLRNRIELIKPLEFGTRYELVVTIGDTRDIPQGKEFDLNTEFLLDGEPVWRSVMTVLNRVKGMPKPASKPAPEVGLASTDAQYIQIKVPENQGRKYAKVSGDYNPIHLYEQTAKFFGFKKAIAHGMWTAAKSLSLLEGQLGKSAKTFDVDFKQPVFLPSTSSLKYVAGKKGAKFELLSEKESKVQFVGQVTV